VLNGERVAAVGKKKREKKVVTALGGGVVMGGKKWAGGAKNTPTPRKMDEATGVGARRGSK